MATFLDVGLFGYFGVIFPVLLVFLLVFAVLTKTQFFGENKGVYALIAFSISMIMLFSPDVVNVINVMAPWFVLIFIFSIFMLLALMVLGVKAEAITNYMSGDWEVVHWFILAFGIIIAIGALASVYGGSLLPYTDEAGDTIDDGDLPDSEMSTEGGGTTGKTTSTGDFNQNVGRVLFHPKVIGLIFIMLIASFTIRMMAGKTS